MLRSGGARKRRSGLKGVQNQDFVNTLNTNNIYTDNISFTNANGTVIVNVGPIGTTSNVNQGTQAIAIGSNAGLSNQGCNSIAIGFRSGETSQGGTSVAIGSRAGLDEQGSCNIAIGTQAQQINNVGGPPLPEASIAIGQAAGQNNQKQFSIAIGAFAGQNDQASESLSIGYQTSQSNNQGYRSVHIGYQAGQNAASSTTYCNVAIGYRAGWQELKSNTVAIGNFAGTSQFGSDRVAIGDGAGNFTSFVNNSNAIAIGYRAGFGDQAGFGFAIGSEAGYIGQNVLTTTVGYQSGSWNQNWGCIAIGAQAGYTGQQSFSTAIGTRAGVTNQPANSIIIGNTPPPPVPAYAANRVYMGPLTVTATPPGGLVQYDNITYEMVYNIAKTFVEKHPVEKNKYLVHACLEGPEAGVYYRGKGCIEKDNFYAIIELPTYVAKITKTNTFNIFVSLDNEEFNNSQSEDDDDIKLLASDIFEGNKFKVISNKKCCFSYNVYATREYIDIEIPKANNKIKGEGPYTYL